MNFYLFLNFEHQWKLLLRLDCLTYPAHQCCNPHPATKRHARLPVKQARSADRGRVTATVTRILSSVSW